MLMRERSGLSGRRRGSQNPGTAIGSAVAAAEPGGADVAGGAEPGGFFVACAYATAGAKVVNIATRTHAAPRQQVSECSLIRRPLNQNRGDHSIVVAAGQS